MDQDHPVAGTSEGAIADDVEPKEPREPIVATFDLRIVLRGPDGTPAPTIEELSEKLAAGLGWGYVSTISGERTDR